MKKILGLSLVPLTYFLYRCGRYFRQTPAEKIIGKWQELGDDKAHHVLIFYTDGTFESMYVDDAGNLDSEPESAVYAWIHDGNTIVLTYQMEENREISIQHDITFDGNIMTMVERKGGWKHIYQYQK
ncbi:MAG: hypothetical protein Q4P20_08090 [Eubacteriales bacterium]|nr:hypothetical protein [Eubacteriales bacterium]